MKRTITIFTLTLAFIGLSSFSNAQTSPFQTGLELAHKLAPVQSAKKHNTRQVEAVTGTPKFKYSFNWNTNLSRWDTTQRVAYTYDVNDRVIEEINQDTAAGTWKSNSKIVYFYSSTSAVFMDSLYYYMWNDQTSSYTLFLWEIFTTNSTTHVITINMYSDYTGYGLGVINSMRITLYMASDNQTLIAETIQQVPNPTAPLANTDSLYLTQDVNGNQLTQESFRWIAYSGIWRKNSFNSNTYDSNNNNTTSLSQLYDTVSTSYINSSLDSMFYNSFNNETLKTSKHNTMNGWVNGSTTNTYYKNSTELDTVIAKNWISSAYVNDTKDWYTGFGTLTTKVTEVNSNENTFLIYPNPSKGKFIIEFSGKHQQMNSDVYNMIGEKVLQQTCTLSGAEGSTIIDLSNSPKGIYFVKVSDGTNSFTKKIIVE